MPIEGIFRQHAIEINHVVNLSAGDPHDHFGFVGDDEIVVHKAILSLPFVNKGLTGWQRKEWIGHVVARNWPDRLPDHIGRDQISGRQPGATHTRLGRFGPLLLKSAAACFRQSARAVGSEMLAHLPSATDCAAFRSILTAIEGILRCVLAKISRSPGKPD